MPPFVPVPPDGEAVTPGEGDGDGPPEIPPDKVSVPGPRVGVGVGLGVAFFTAVEDVVPATVALPAHPAASVARAKVTASQAALVLYRFI